MKTKHIVQIKNTTRSGYGEQFDITDYEALRGHFSCYYDGMDRIFRREDWLWITPNPTTHLSVGGYNAYVIKGLGIVVGCTFVKAKTITKIQRAVRR